MTQNKAQKTAARQRMAETGEPYSVARRAVQDHPPGAGEAGQIFVRYRLARTFELEIDEEVWASADTQTRARLIADGAGQGSSHSGTTLTELIAHDLDERGAGAFTETDRGWEEEYYADGAASEGISVEEFKAREESGQARERAQERTDQAQERADRAQEQAEEARGRAEETQERADEAADVADEARHVADDTREDGDREAWERAEREAGLARERAERAQARADREEERAEREQERADRERERADDGHAFGYDHPRSGPPWPPRPPRPPRPRRLPRLPRLPG